MLFAAIIFTFTTAILASATTQKQPIPCFYGERTGRNPSNPTCGINAWCKPAHIAHFIVRSSKGVPGFCEESPPNCTPGGSGCGVNGVCSKRGYCELAVLDTSHCDEEQPWECAPGSRECQNERLGLFSMCNRCGVCVPIPQSLRPFDHQNRDEEGSSRESPGTTALLVQHAYQKQKRDQYPACGLMGMEPRAGLPARPLLAQCGQDAVCTPTDPNCSSKCTSYCIPKPVCSPSKPCASGFMCTSPSARSTPLQGSEYFGQCERIREPALPANATVAAGRSCGLDRPICPQPQQYCASSEANCFSLDVCPGTCKVWPERPPPKYPSCGGYTRKPNPCPSPNICVNDPYNGPSCGMSCDYPGVCVRPIPCGGTTRNTCPPDTKCVRDPRNAPCNVINQTGNCETDLGGLCV